MSALGRNLPTTATGQAVIHRAKKLKRSDELINWSWVAIEMGQLASFLMTPHARISVVL